MVPKPEEEDEDSDVASKEVAFQFSLPWARANADTDEEEEEEPESDWVAERVVVGIGLVDAMSVEVLDGVEAGDQVVVVGQSNLKDGAAVMTPKMKAEWEAAKAAKAEAAEESEESEEQPKDVPEGEG
jgi:hypothetical protein